MKEEKTNYSSRRHNRNKNYQGNKKKNLLIESNDGEEVKNILSFNEEIKQNIPNYENLEVVPTKKEKQKKNFFSNKILKYGLSLTVFIVVIFGASYSFFTYRKEDSRQADISSGEVYVRLVENETSITLNKMYPRTNEEARARNDNYFDYTIKAKNTSPTKSILYTININNGEDVSGKTRIDPKYIRIDLQEKVNNNYVYIKEGVNLDDYSFQGIILTNTTSEITKEYRLRIWINDDVIISDTDTNKTHTEAQFANLYANFDISVNSEDKKIAYGMFANKADTETVINFRNISSDSNGKGLYILPGTENDAYPIYYYRGNINNNNVIFGDYCWQIIRTTDTGGIKMIYNGAVTGNGKTCENTSHGSRILSGDKKFIDQTQSVSDAGYMRNTRYIYKTLEPTSGAYYGTSVEYGKYDTNNPGTNVYRLVDDGNGSVGTTLDEYHHYTCNETTANGICTTVRYYFYIRGTVNYYINLSGGEMVEDAIYKMTGNGDATVKTRNSSYVLNQSDSIIKGAIDSWFRTNLTNELDNTRINYVNYLEDTVYCNDRTIYELGGWNPNGGDLTKELQFGLASRILNNWFSTTNVPSTVCPNETDRFSVSSSIAHLKYPVGLITADEIIMAGSGDIGYISNSSYYLYTGNHYWSMSPRRFDYLAYEYRVSYKGSCDAGNVDVSSGARPVVSLKSIIEFEIGGDGTPTNPYVVKYN